MTLEEVAPVLFPLLVWAELRALPLIRTAMGWIVAHAIKEGVTVEDAKKHEPSSWTVRGGKTGLALLLVTVLGCSASSSIRDAVPELRRSWSLFRDSSAPAAGVDSSALAELGSSVDEALGALDRASRE